MLDLTKPVQTRDGRKVRILCTDRKAGNAGGCVVGLVTSRDGYEYIELWHENGTSPGSDHNNYLVNVPEKVKLVVDVYQNEAGQYVAVARSATHAQRDCLASIPIEFEVPQ